MRMRKHAFLVVSGKTIPFRRLGVRLPARLRFYHLSAMPLPYGALATSSSMLAKLPRSSIHVII